ncbi:MAG TPA: FAD:protein FMN transferase, partial [Actinomycetes bacterium]|nr:FAD:protein FMN transferase [Actinomycetes bacterium]
TSGTTHRGAHLVDPVDGAPVTGVLSVTVTGPSLLWADVLATAAFVRGAGALAVVEAVPGYDALVVAADSTRTATEGLVQLPLT